MHSRFPPTDRSLPDLCEPVTGGQRPPVAPLPPPRRPAVGPAGSHAAAGMDRTARPPLLAAVRKGGKCLQNVHLVLVCHVKSQLNPRESVVLI